MGKRSKIRRKYSDDSGTTSSSAISDYESDSDTEAEHSRRSRCRHRSHADGKRGSNRGKDSRREKKMSRKREEKRRERDRKSRKDSKRRSRRVKRKKEADLSDGNGSESSSGEECQMNRLGAECVVRDLLKEFPFVVGDLKQLLQMIDSGQAVDIKGISEKSLVECLKKLFWSLNLKEKIDGVFLLRSNAHPTLEIVGPMLSTAESAKDEASVLSSVPAGMDHGKVVDDGPSMQPSADAEPSAPGRRVIGPAMPSAELLAAAAKLTEAQADLRDADLEEYDELFIGPAPPAVVSEVASANEAERFEEVTRIMGAEVDSPYDIIGVNRNMSIENVKKRYWKLSLMVHPDKCSHPQAQNAFVKLNKAFKDLQDPDKRKVMDDKIKKKEEEEAMKAELRSMREAALWRRSQGLSIEGDDILLAETEVKEAPKRDEWMTTLPPERKPGMAMHSTFFSKSGKEGRGDTSVWIDTPSDRVQKAKMNYLEAYNEASALAASEEQKRSGNRDADLVDQYNKAKRSKTLVEKHQEETAEQSRSKKKSKRKQLHQQPQEDGEWVGMHPWKPWDREKDLTAGRQSVKLDSDNLKKGLTSRFSAGSFQRNFL